MNIAYEYVPEMGQFWIGATDGVHTSMMGLMPRMTIEQVIEILKRTEKNVEEHTHTH